ncbi:MAG: SPFH domain-containing protein [Alphaproteobacteria bacterium]|nr:SPFH domain-containing protein [Alphaproteobacteria bacterium]
MGIWDKLSGQARAQFLDVIQSLEGDGDTLLRRFPIYDQAITDQSKLIVREGQVAVFLSGGKLSEVFGPGTYTLDTPNSPIWSFFHTLGYGLENPYKGDVLFVSTTQHTDNGWGTQNPFMMRDAEFGPVRLRAFGSFSFRVKDAAVFVRELVGTDGHFTVDEVVGQLKKRVVVAFTTAVARLGVPVLDMAAHQAELGDRIRDVMGPELEAAYGIGLTDFTVANISLPEEVEKALDTRSRMGVLGDLGAYTRLQAADAIGDAARNPGVGGMGASLGVGVGVGQVMAGALGQAMAPSVGAPGAPQAATPPPLPDDRFHYAGPQGQQQAEAPAIAASVRAAPDARHLVWRKGWSGWKPAKEVPEIAALLTSDEPPPLPDDDGPPPLP